MGASGALIDNKAIICGGSSSQSKCYSYNTNDKQWTELCEMTTPRYRHASTKFGPENKSLWVTGTCFFFQFTV